MKSSFFDVHGHMHTGVLWVICVLWNFRIRSSTLRVPYGARMGTVRALADALTARKDAVTARAGSVRISKHPYVVHKSHERLF